MEARFLKYKLFLEHFSLLLDEHFKSQKDYIFCQKGCSTCCKKGNYPLSEIEFELVKEGILTLVRDEKLIIKEKLISIEESFNRFILKGRHKKEFLYECPLLFDNSCLVYDYRPIICRTYGLVQIDSFGDNRLNMPSCAYLGLNYSNVWDEKINDFSVKKAEKFNIKTVPKAFNIHYNSLIKSIPNYDFGELKLMNEWLQVISKNSQLVGLI